MSINWCVDKQNIVYSYTRISLGLQREWAAAMFSTVNTSWAKAGYFIKHCGKSFHSQECPETGKNLQTELLEAGFLSQRWNMFLNWPMQWFCKNTENRLSAIAVTGCSRAYCSKAGNPAVPRAHWLARSLQSTGPQGWARATHGTRLLRSTCPCSRHFTDLPISPAWYIWHF